jgi:acyl carrier protein
MEDRVRNVLAAVLGVDPAQINEETSAQTIAAWDSLAQIKLIVALEDEFAIQLPDDTAGRLHTYRAITAALRACGCTG